MHTFRNLHVNNEAENEPMFDNLSNRLKSVAEQVRGKGRLTEANIDAAVRDVRRALIEADVALPVVKDFIEGVRKRAVGAEITRSLSPGQAFIKIINDELADTLGSETALINLRHQRPVVLLLAGLQGAGKTTTAAKLALHLQDVHKQKVMLASLDTRRPAAILQLRQLAEQAGAGFVPTDTDATVLEIARNAVDEARKSQADVVILDSAGRTRLDTELLDELGQLQDAVHPHETLFVIDSMAGQDAVNVAAAFGAALALTGVILTKADGDARGGAALSVKFVTGQPIKFLGTGEDLSGLEVFHPDRMASRILGMGDVLSLVEEVEQKVDRDKAERLAKKVRKGSRFDLEDLRPDAESRRYGQFAGEVAAAGQYQSGPDGRKGRRTGDRPANRDHQFDDAARAPLPQDDQRLPQASHRVGRRPVGSGRQSPVETAPADAEDDETHVEGRHKAHDAGIPRNVAGRLAWPAKSGARVHIRLKSSKITRLRRLVWVIPSAGLFF